MIRPENVVHEGLNLLPLLYNPMLPILAKAIVEEAFRDFKTIEELLAIEPPKDGMRHFALCRKTAGYTIFPGPR
jgi:hypothetical protein